MTPALVLSKNIFYRNRESEHIFNLEDCVRIIISWSEWGDSNSRHLEPKSSALPTGPHPEISLPILVQLAGEVKGKNVCLRRRMSYVIIC